MKQYEGSDFYALLFSSLFSSPSLRKSLQVSRRVASCPAVFARDYDRTYGDPKIPTIVESSRVDLRRRRVTFLRRKIRLSNNSGQRFICRRVPPYFKTRTSLRPNPHALFTCGRISGYLLAMSHGVGPCCKEAEREREKGGRTKIERRQRQRYRKRAALSVAFGFA